MVTATTRRRRTRNNVTVETTSDPPETEDYALDSVFVDHDNQNRSSPPLLLTTTSKSLVKPKSPGFVVAGTISFYLVAIVLVYKLQQQLPQVIVKTCPRTTFGRQQLSSSSSSRGHNVFRQPLHDNNNNERQEMYQQHIQSIATNWTHFITNFRNSTFDSWGKSYQQVKQDLYNWKSHQYVPYLQSGDTIFESACGIGLNLLLTMEILQEHGLSNIGVEGNDVAPDSVQLANRILRHELHAGQKTEHAICVGDSTNLKYIPDNSYHLVFTGYITPLLDPLDINLGMDESFRRLEQICSTKNNKEKNHNKWTSDSSSLLYHLAQLRQEEWFGKWVGERIRIARPGAPVIVEQVSPPFCEAQHDWGGVDRSFWKRAIKRFQWDVIPESVLFGDDQVFSSRYHVFMRKTV